MTTTNNNEAAYDSISGGRVGWQEANSDLNEYKARERRGSYDDIRVFWTIKKNFFGAHVLPL